MEKCTKNIYCVFPQHTKKSLCKATNAFHFGNENQQIFCCPTCDKCFEQSFKAFVKTHGDHLIFLSRKIKKQMLKSYYAEQQKTADFSSQTEMGLPIEIGCQSEEIGCQSEEIISVVAECQSEERITTDAECQTENETLLNGSCQTETSQTEDQTSQTTSTFESLILKQIGNIFLLLNENFDNMKKDIEDLKQNSTIKIPAQPEKKKSVEVTRKRKETCEPSTSTIPPLTKRKYQRKSVPQNRIIVIDDTQDDIDKKIDLDHEKELEEFAKDIEEDERDRMYKEFESYF